MTEWEKLYKEAVLETDWSKIEARIQAADAAISERLHEFTLNHGGTPEENRTIEEALDNLEVLSRDVAAWRSKAS